MMGLSGVQGYKLQMSEEWNRTYTEQYALGVLTENIVLIILRETVFQHSTFKAILENQDSLEAILNPTYFTFLIFCTYQNINKI